MKKIILFFVYFFCFICTGKPQGDEIMVMHYNLMNYGFNPYYCDTNNYPDLGLTVRDNCLKTILKQYMPDIFTVNEIYRKSKVSLHLLESCLNTDGVNSYEMAVPTNISHSPNVTNQMFYNSGKFGLAMQDSLYTLSFNRDINVYKLFYKAFDLSTTKDTAFLYCFVMHLPQNADDRDYVTSVLMNYLVDHNIKDNFLTMGDFNIENSYEACYQNMINPTDAVFRFNDPINMPGDWTKDSFAKIHTQATHNTNDGTCITGGGLNNRFDIILASNNIMNKQNHYGYIPDTYTATGQDGLHFNKSIKDLPANISAPSAVIDALFCMSDHLPVLLKLSVDQSSVPPVEEGVIDVTFQNPVEDNMNLSIRIHSKTSLTVELLNAHGQSIFKKNIEEAGINTQLGIDASELRKGIYFLKVSDSENNSVTKKFFKP